jgi:hypothetical protein
LQADPVLNESVRLTVAVVNIDWKSVGFGSSVTSVESVAVAVEGAIAAAAEHIEVKKSPSGQHSSQLSVPCSPLSLDDNGSICHIPSTSACSAAETAPANLQPMCMM